jgi:hypothetical protein
MKTILRLWLYLYGLFGLTYAIWLMLSVTSCNNTEATYIRCVVDSVWLVPQASVAEPYPIYRFHTDCGVTITAPTKQYKNGDIIEFIKQ